MNRRQSFIKLSAPLKLLRYFHNNGVCYTASNIRIFYVITHYMYNRMQEELKKAKFEATAKVKELTEVKTGTYSMFLNT